MKNLILAILMMTGQLFAADPWTKADTALEITYQSLNFADWMQTLAIREPGSGYYETNKMLGRHPSRGSVNAYFLASGALHYIAARALSGKWRRGFQAVSIAVESQAVGNNYRIGVRVKL